MSDHTRLRIAALLVVLALVVGCGGSEPVQETAPVARPVKLLVVGDGEAATEKSFPGSVAAGDQVDLAFRVGGPLIELPVTMSFWDMPPEKRAEIGISDSLCRLACGIESAEDLIEDLLGALEAARKAPQLGVVASASC